jgi:hypothetical protein
MRHQDAVVSNRFVRVLDEWVALHDQDIYFPLYPHLPQVMVTRRGWRVRANEAFLGLPLPLQRALVAHEIGHRELGHLEVGLAEIWSLRRERALRVGVGRAFERQVEADRFACSRLGTATYIAALRQICDLLRERGAPWQCTQELELRLTVLQSEPQQQAAAPRSD